VDYYAAGLDAERARAALSQAIGVPELAGTIQVLEAPEEWPSPRAAGSLDVLVRTAWQNRVEVRMAMALLERAQAAVRSAQAEAKANWQPYFGYKRTAGFNTVIGGVSIPLAVRDRNQGRIEEALAGVREGQAQLEAARRRVHAEVTGALVAVERRAEMLSAMQAGMLDRAEQTSQIALAAYQEGGADLFRLLDAQRSQNQIRLLHSSMLHDYQLSRIELETAIGTELPPSPAQGGPVANRQADEMAGGPEAAVAQVSVSRGAGERIPSRTWLLRQGRSEEEQR
jgi:cobalt-zinc-cadmium efflux system outer membrane protein